MTAKEFVLSKVPTAFSQTFNFHGLRERWIVWVGVGLYGQLADGISEAESWINAEKYLKNKEQHETKTT